ncbi:MAG: BMP family ABC transporter substrate-binding protein, partial [bacterium]
TAVLQTAEKNGKYAFGWDSDMSAFGPKAHLASAIINWGPYYIKAIDDVLKGSWQTGRTIWGVKEDLNDLVKIADVVPEETKAQIAKVKAGLKDDSFEVFTGPIVDNAGKERLPKDQKADRAWKDKVDFFVAGVEGKVPSGS